MSKLKIRTILINLGTKTTIHAIPNLTTTDSIILRFLWIFAFISSFTYCFYLIILTLKNYLEYSVIVNIQVISDEPIEFPVISFCNLNRLNPDNSALFSDYTNSLFSKINNLSSSIQSNNSIAWVRYDFARSYLNSQLNMDLNDSSLRKIGFDLESSMLLTCIYEQSICTSNEFYYFKSFKYGNCFSFNYGLDSKGNSIPIKNGIDIGKENGFKLELFLGFINKSTNGLRFSIHHQNNPILIDYNGFDLLSGYQYDIPIERFAFKKQPWPYSNCISKLDKSTLDSYENNLILNFMALNFSMLYYNAKFCFLYCKQYYVMIKCNCTDTRMPFLNNTKNFCTSQEELCCLREITQNLARNKKEFKCWSYCPSECYSVKYKERFSMFPYPTDEFYFMLREQASFRRIVRNSSKFNEELARKNLIRLNIFYEELSYQLVEEKPSITFDNLIANIGLIKEFIIF